jgi:hypothetical protein
MEICRDCRRGSFELFLEKGRVMKIRPQMVVGLVLAGCVAITGVHFATAQQEQGGAQKKAAPAAQQQDQDQNAQPQQKGAQQKQRQGNQPGKRDGIQRPDRGDKDGVREERSRTRIDSKQRTTVRGSSSTQFIRSSLVMGAPVTLHGGASLGTVQEFVINEGGCVDYMIVSYDNRLVPVPWSVATFQAEDRVIMLDAIDEAQLAQLPTITDFAELQNTEFVTKVNTFYKVEERSRDRRSNDANRDDRSGKSRRDDRSGKSDRAGDQNRDGQKKSDSRPAAKNRGADTKKSDAPKSDAPKADAPKADAPKADAPKADAPKADAPKADAPKADAKKSDEKQ